MTTSASYNFLSNEEEIITDAFVQMGIHFPGEEIPAENYDYAQRKLNRMIKFWGRQQHLWTMGVGTLFLTPGTNTYTLNDSTARWTNSPIITTLSGDEAIGQTALSVTSSAGMTAGDYIGVVVSDSTIQWSTISVVNSSVLVTVAAALTVAGVSGTPVYTYTTIAQPPVRVEWIVRRDSSAIDIELSQDSRKDYDTRTNKSLAGLPLSYYYDPKVGNGTLFVYQTPNDGSIFLRITYRREIQDFDSSTNTMDFPIEWEECLVLNLALRLAPLKGIGVDDPIYQQTQLMATDVLRSLIEHDDDNMPLNVDIGGDYD